MGYAPSFLLLISSCVKCYTEIDKKLTFQLLGIGVLVIGIILQTNDGFIDDDILALLDEVSLGGITLKQLIFIVIGIVIALGCFTIVTSLCGGVGALFKLRVLLIIVSIKISIV